MQARSLVLCLTFLQVQTACTHSQDTNIKVHKSAHEDASYLSAHEAYTRDIQVTRNLTTRYALAATLLSKSFRDAFAERFETLFSTSAPLLTETSSRTGFFVTMHSPIHAGYDLDDVQLWSLTLTDRAGEAHQPVFIRRLAQKERWEPFFTHVHTWSKEYLVVFDSNASLPTSEFSVNESITLTISNADARVTLTW